MRMIDNLSLSSEAPILVIGAASLDAIGRLQSGIKMGTSNPARIRYAAGGAARNVAENLARLGQPVILLSVVGEDPNGIQLLRQTREAGVNVDYIQQSRNHPTGAYLGVVNASGILQLAVDDMRVIHELTPELIRQHESLFKEASLLFIDANLTKETLRTVISLARKAKLPVCADPTSNILAEKLKPYLSKLFMLTPNSSEAAILAGQPVTASRRKEAMEAAKKLVSYGVGVVIIALAEFGVCYATSETSGQIPAIQTRILDPTGAGDALTAATLFALLNDISIDEAIRLGISAASLTLGHAGAVRPDLSLELLYDHLVI
jgi:pseudouridine kinase